MSNEIVLAAVVVAAIVVIYLLRHVIALAVRLIILAALVLAGYWAWEHRGEIIDALEPYLGDFGERLRELDLPDLPGLSEEPGQPEDAPAPGTIGVVDDRAAPDGLTAPGRPTGPAVPEPGR